ncbi:hypothetical protein FKG94_05960 [Exilibacterium tricleocarpae]|uniref:Outer membrane protein assembly factor BamE n=1 Tax=Exilibacterium tricleocarpae TaxID=2591008 RepID=A0A545U416_9GAMM|nr:hypothetical protein [Exilibacterium tricleocarpae]TQV84200.1 hypothetical protein FKG94_05960 [Exilibacterium tricleocarpae]
MHRQTTALFVATALVLSACAVIDVRETTAFNTGRGAVPHQTLRDIRPQQTRADWLLQHLGYPERITPQADAAEIWHYRLEERRDNLYRLILLFQYRASKTYRRDVYLKLVDRVVVDIWGDLDIESAPPPPGSPVINRKKKHNLLPDEAAAPAAFSLPAPALAGRRTVGR